MSDSTKKEYYGALDLLRATGIIYVVFYHGIFAYLYNEGPIFTGILTVITKMMNLGVPVFFILSGFLMANQLNSNISINVFYRNRFAKTYPTYFILVLYLFITQNATIPNLFLHLVGFHNWYPDYSYALSQQLWSIAVEIQFYVVVPFIFRYWYPKLEIKNIVIWLACILFLAVLYILLNGGGDPQKSSKALMFVYGHTLINFCGLLWGMLLFKLYNTRQTLRHSYKIFIATVIIILGLGQWLSPGIYPANNDFSQPLKALVACMLILIWQFSAFVLVYLLLKKNIKLPTVLRFIAGVSYQWYLLHFLILDWTQTQKIGNHYLSFTIYFVISFLVACISTYVLERPLLRWGRNFRRRKT